MGRMAPAGPIRPIPSTATSGPGVPRARPPPPDDRRRARLPLLPGLPALGQLAGRRARVPPALAPPLAPAHRVADRVLGDAPLVRLFAHPPLAAGLPQADVHVVGVRDRPDARPARDRDA